MRLTKVQKALKAKNIEYKYEEKHGCGEIGIKHNGRYYMIDEITGNHGRTPIGIFTNLPGFDKWARPTQQDIVKYIENNL